MGAETLYWVNDRTGEVHLDGCPRVRHIRSKTEWDPAKAALTPGVHADQECLMGILPLRQAKVVTEADAVAGEVWQEADNVLLLCVVPGEVWGSFLGERIPWDAPLIARPLRRLLDAAGNLVPERRHG